MKNTKHLFDEDKQTPEGMVSVSQLQSFMSCGKTLEYLLTPTSCCVALGTLSSHL